MREVALIFFYVLMYLFYMSASSPADQLAVLR